MSLQLALLLIGLVVIAAVVIGSYDRARLAKRAKELTSQVRTSTFTREALSILDKAFHPVSRLDFNPKPLRGAAQRFIRGKDNIPVLTVNEDDAAFYEELERIEQAASMPIDVELNPASIHGDADRADKENNPSSSSSWSENTSMPDAAIDFIIELPGKGPLSRNRALGIYKQNEYLLNKPRRLYGLRYIEGVWSNLDNDTDTAQYSDLLLAIQLVDKSGAIDESELNTFGQLGLKLADSLNRPSKMATTFELALQQATELDSFCQQYDTIAGLNVMPSGKQGFSETDIKKIALAAGLQFGPMNIYHCKNDKALGCRHMFSMANLFEPGTFHVQPDDQEQVKGLTFFMQIPCAYAPAKAFDKMVAVANLFSQKLDGYVSDQDNQRLTSEGTQSIRRHIDYMASEMQKAGIMPGSEIALRLFNA
ncbi:MAG: cell division protein ZipA C-terminal FtsZ-binding domain-containing protein [Acidiferrobacterales bacterium]